MEWESPPLFFSLFHCFQMNENDDYNKCTSHAGHGCMEVSYSSKKKIQQPLYGASSHAANNICWAVTVGRCLGGCKFWLAGVCVCVCVSVCPCRAMLWLWPTHAAEFVNACARIKSLAIHSHTWLVKGSSQLLLHQRLLDRWTCFLF